MTTMPQCNRQIDRQMDGQLIVIIVIIIIIILLLLIIVCMELLQCFNVVDWVTGTASHL